MTCIRYGRLGIKTCLRLAMQTSHVLDFDMLTHSAKPCACFAGDGPWLLACHQWWAFACWTSFTCTSTSLTPETLKWLCRVVATIDAFAHVLNRPTKSYQPIAQTRMTWHDLKWCCQRPRFEVVLWHSLNTAGRLASPYGSNGNVRWITVDKDGVNRLWDWTNGFSRSEITYAGVQIFPALQIKILWQEAEKCWWLTREPAIVSSSTS